MNKQKIFSNSQFIFVRIKLIAIAISTLSVILLASGISIFPLSPAQAQRVSSSDVWQIVYEKLPDLPRENQYISKESGKVAENSTLASRLIRYHLYVKERAPNYRLDWKLTLADYLDANEIMYENTYPGNDTLRQNPLDGDRTVIKNLPRHQRDALVQILTNIFNPSL
jgi:hypothetical protein